ncbi:phosphoglycerate kinase [Candidatus Uhrbacteria bacterium]|nr:phosphoglycerate kinase [Candidatus Uhrbacteria bacterium]
MKLRRLTNTMNLRGKRVLVRIDGNVPIVKGRVVDGPHGRIARSAVGINWLVQRGARVIVMTHLGRPNGKRVAAYSVKPIAKRLSSLLSTRVKVARSVVGVDVKKAVGAMQEGEVLMLENLRFDPREEENAASFAEALGKLGDLYVNDAFAVSHRAHASVDAIVSELPSYAGPLLADELSVLSRLGEQSKRPFVLVLGGLKMTTKIPLLHRLLPALDAVLLGGALATAFLVAQGKAVGKSVYEKESVALCAKLLKTHAGKLVLPVDVVVVRSLRRDAKRKVVSVDVVSSNDRIVDVGPKSVKAFQEILSRAKTIVWNGPLGYGEIEPFCAGTCAVAKAIGERTGKAMTVVGGGDTMPLIESLGLADKFTLLSTGGGAMLQFLSGEPLPGVEALRV